MSLVVKGAFLATMIYSALFGIICVLVGFGTLADRGICRDAVSPVVFGCTLIAIALMGREWWLNR
jgi:hypothetical protein